MPSVADEKISLQETESDLQRHNTQYCTYATSRMLRINFKILAKKQRASVCWEILVQNRIIISNSRLGQAEKYFNFSWCEIIQGRKKNIDNKFNKVGQDELSKKFEK